MTLKESERLLPGYLWRGNQVVNAIDNTLIAQELQQCIT